MKSKIAIFGGTFNPIHLGHLMVAEFIRSEENLEKVVFLPTGDPPHKAPLISAEDRLKMVEYAIEDNPYFTLSDIEVKREGNSYTIDTIRHFLREGYSEIYYIIGSDTLFQLKTWREYKEVLKILKFYIMRRPGDIEEEILKEIEDLKSNYGTEIILVDGPQYKISSTEIRNRIKLGKSVKYLLPQSVIEYIDRRDLYE